VVVQFHARPHMLIESATYIGPWLGDVHSVYRSSCKVFCAQRFSLEPYVNRRPNGFGDRDVGKAILPAAAFQAAFRSMYEPSRASPAKRIIKAMSMRPLHDRVLVRRLEEGEQRRGNIIIPDSAKEKPQQAEVKAVGSGKLLDSGERVAPEVKAGDRILFGKYSGAEIKLDGVEYLILREDEILGVVE
jgi:chaperonin GroES